MKLRTLLVAAGSIALLTMAVFAAEGIELKGIKCVMNAKGDAKAAKYVEYKGGRVFFCCDNCPKAFAEKVKKDEVVQAKGNHQLVATGQAAQEKCPFSGGKLNRATAIKVAGASIAFCCENCQGKAKKMEGEKQLVALFGDAVFKKAGFKVPHTSIGAEDEKQSESKVEPLKSETDEGEKKSDESVEPLKSEDTDS